jgi:meromycolic acid enoyl-[acyl-carrier-protein] reductase
MLLDGKRLVITGVRNESSLAFAVAKCAQEEGAEVVLSVLGRALEPATVAAKGLPRPAAILECDFTKPDEVARLRDALASRWDRIDGALHAIAFAPRSCLSGDMFQAAWQDVALTIQTSAYSLRALAEAVLPLMSEHGGSIVGLTTDTRVAWPTYDWMGVAKSALESTARYLARDLGPRRIRVNLVNAGPTFTAAADAIPGTRGHIGFRQRAPLGWDPSDTLPTAKACIALFSDLFPATTGDVFNVDGGAHVVIEPPQSESVGQPSAP